VGQAMEGLRASLGETIREALAAQGGKPAVSAAA